MAEIEVKSLIKKYRLGKEIITAIDNLDISIEPGEFMCILGPSGSGKTTLLHIMAGLETPTKGDILIKDISLGKVKEKDRASFRRKYLGFIFQSYNLISSMTALENVALPLVFSGVKKEEREKKAREMLVQMGLKDRLKNKPTEMSGGQQQRVSIARALISSPRVIFADEPTGNLDSKTSHDIMSILTRKVKESNVTLIMVTHDNDIADYANRVIRMVDGRIVEEKRKGEV